jgi:acetyltransferase-like isoleucine patch superfamily enzyme
MLELLSGSLREFLVWLKFRKIDFASIGRGCVFKRLSNNFSYTKRISLGANVHIGEGAMFDGAGGITVGNGTIFAPGVKIYSRVHNFEHDLRALPFDNVVFTSAVTIGKYVWVGVDVVILPGVTVGDGAVIGAGAVVTQDIPRCAVAAGNPARVLRYRDQDAFAALLSELEPFVYKKFGHKKKFVEKTSIARSKR